MKTRTELSIIAMALAISLSACYKKEETLEERTKKIVEEIELLKQNDIKNKVPVSEIVGKIENKEVFIHKIYDEKTGVSCYFIDYTNNNISCVK